MLQKRCILARVTIDQTLLPEIPKIAGSQWPRGGQKRTKLKQLHRFPRRALHNALALGSTRGRPNPTAIWVPSVARRACQTALRRKCRMFPGLAKPQRNAGAHDPRRVHQTVLRRGCRRKQHYEATRFGLKNTLQFLQKQLLSDCSSKRFQVFFKANLETLK